MRLDADFLKKVLPEAEVLQGTLPLEQVTFAVDTRLLRTDSLFFALSGNKVDGHEFLSEALQKAAGVVVAAGKKDMVTKALSALTASKLVIVVPDTLEALVALATAWRLTFNFPVAAITGSVGKTTTKEITAHMLACAGKKYLVSEGNQNTLLGVAMTISKMDDTYEGALFEVGINKQGEMARIVQMLQPTTGVITCVAHSHIEGLGSVAGVATEKRMLFKYFGPESIGIIQGDQPLLSAVSYPHPVIRFGLKTTNQVQARKVKQQDGCLSFVLKLYHIKFPIVLTKSHTGLLNNILASAALAHHLGVSDTVMMQAIQTLPVCSQRFEFCPLKTYKGTLIDDCYNASPESVKAALLALESVRTKGKKIAVLGDMLELGQNSSFWHRQIGRFLRKVPTLSHLILVGNEVKWVEKTAPVGIKVEKVTCWKDAVSKLSATLEDNAVVLVKGSRGIELHNVVAQFVDKQVQK